MRYTFMDRTRESIAMIKKRLAGIWFLRPAATDTLEEISERWLGAENVETVADALNELCESGAVKRYINGNYTYFYAVDYEKLRCIVGK